MKKNGKLYNFLKSEYIIFENIIFSILEKNWTYNFARTLNFNFQKVIFRFFYENFNFKKIIAFFFEKLFSKISDYIIFKKINFFKIL